MQNNICLLYFIYTVLYSYNLVDLYMYVLDTTILYKNHFKITPSIPNCKSFDFFYPKFDQLVLFKKFVQI
jgi:hypothetical protein